MIVVGCLFDWAADLRGTAGDKLLLTRHEVKQSIGADALEAAECDRRAVMEGI